MTEHDITTLDALTKLYGASPPASLTKEKPALTATYRAFIEAAPFAILATSSAEGLDASPRGDGPGFVRVVDAKTLLMPDRRGNNRLDSLKNIVVDPRVGLLFMIPTVSETLRVNGRASITTDPALRESFAMDGKLPATVIRIAIDTVYFQCARALLRSSLWKPEAWPKARTAPTSGEMLRDADQTFDGSAYDAGLDQRQRDTLY